MIKLHDLPVLWTGGAVREATPAMAAAREKTMACRILRAHNTGSGDGLLHLTFDSLISHDITYVGVIQTAKASGLTEFPVPYVLTNCHNSLCAVGGTINADDHAFGLSAAVKYGGDYVPANQAVIHQYAREMLAGCGKMVLGSDSHTRYGALGTLGVGEGGGEIVKQLLRNTYDLAAPQVILVHVTGRPRHGVGPHDVAIALCGAVYKNGFVKNKVLEFVGDGIGRLSMDYRIGIDVMTTETACLTSIWETDGAVLDYLALHGRAGDYAPLHPEDGAYYDGLIELDLSAIEPMAALPFHPSEAVTLRELIADPGDILREVEKRAADQFGGKVQLHLTDKVKDGKLHVEQGVIAGCAGGLYDNIAEAAAILDGCDVGSGNFDFSVYPPSVPVELELVENGVSARLLRAGAVIRQGGDAQERRKLAPENALDGFRAAIDETRKLIKRDQRGAQRQDLDRVGRDGGVDDVDLVAHDQPEHEQHHRHGRTHERAGIILPFTGGEHLAREHHTRHDREHGKHTLQAGLGERAAAQQQPKAAEREHRAEQDTADRARTL